MKRKPFLSIDYNKPGKGVKKGQSTLFTFPNFFALLKRKIWELIKVNLLWIVTSFPLLFGFVALSGGFYNNLKTPSDFAFPIVEGMSLFGGNAGLSAVLTAVGIQSNVEVPTTLAKVFFGITALAVFTFGMANTGMAYMHRGYTREEYVDMPSDFFRAIKKNFFQSIIVGFFDLLILAAVSFALTFYLTLSEEFVFQVSLFICFVLALIYFMARFYLYPLLVTFKLSTWKIFKNAFIFALVGIKRNVVALIFTLLIIAANILIYVFALPIGGILPFFITISLCSFISTYAAWPNIKKIMIDPYYKTDTHTSQKADDEPIFTDRG